MEILKHLEEYSNLTDDANQNLKSSFWHLTKSRKRYQGGFLATVDCSYSPEELREEFSALSVLKIGEPSLGDEAGSKEKSEDNSFEWKLVDVAKVKQKDECKTQPTSKTGLRQRSHKANLPQAKPSIQEEDLKSIDPLSLFGGLAPQDLRRAQTGARKALEQYVDAANKAAEIQELIASKR